MSTRNKTEKVKKSRINVRELVIFALLGTIMYCSKAIMEFLPNIHPLAMLTVAYTIVYRSKALIPIYVYVILNGIFAGFALWWVPYLYIWTILWGAAMLLPKNMKKKTAYIVCPLLCMLHGLLFGTLYAPAEAIMYGMNFKQTLLWISAGLVWDAVQGAGNLVIGMLTVPISELLKKLDTEKR